MAKAKKGLAEKFFPFVVVLSIVLAFFVGTLWQKVRNLEDKSGINEGKGGGPPSAVNLPSDQPTSNKLAEEQAKKISPVTDKDHVKGDKNAVITMIEYSDFQCPYCKSFHTTAQQVLKEYATKVKWVFRHFPLEQIHPNARPAALASECVNKLGGNDAFWKFTDLVFADQNSTLADLPGTAAKAGVNRAAVKTCIDKKEYEAVVDSDYQGGSGAGIRGTPGGFIINKKGEAWSIPGAIPYESLKTMIEEALKS